MNFIQSDIDFQRRRALQRRRLAQSAFGVKLFLILCAIYFGGHFCFSVYHAGANLVR